MTLTADQRLLLHRHTGGWMLAQIIVATDYGLATLRERNGGCAWPADLRPDLPFNRSQTCKDRIEGRSSVGHDDFGDHLVVSLSFTQIRRWAAAVPDPVREAVRVSAAAAAAERDRTELWCRCHWTYEGDPKPHKDFLGRDHYHPSAAEDEKHWAALRALDERQDELLLTALGLGATAPVQLDLFEVSV